MYLKFVILVCFITVTYCLPIDKSVNNVNLIDNNDVKNPISVDQALNSANSKLKSLELETTTSGQLLFNNNEPEEDKIFKINDADELVDQPQSKQASGGFANVQSLIDQTDTISKNLETMIKDMTQNKRHASASMLRLMHTNVRRLNTNLVRLNNRVNSMPVFGGNAQGAASSAGSATSGTSSVANSVSNATINAATQVNQMVSNIRNQLNNVSNDINNMLKNIRLPGTSSANAKPTPAPTG